jgi:myo-inositol-1(or 4)-monophosphatase
MKRFLYFALKIGENASRELYKKFKKEAPLARGTSKEVKSIYDKVSDRIIISSLEKNFPSHSYLTEETGFVDKKSDYLWIIDPLDGTGNFTNHNPFFAVSIALWKKGKPLLGVIEAPALGERFVALYKKGAFYYDLIRKRKFKTKVSKVKETQLSYLVYCEGGEKNKLKVLKIINKYFPKVKEMRKLGSAALELVWVGTGRAEGYLTPKISFWDIAAGILFVKEAGGKLYHFDGKPYQWQDFKNINQTFNLFATNGKINNKIFS